jgi:hypothetical protein
MIIGINGYSGSGKDTVGTIIQYLLCPHHNPNESLQKILKDPNFHEWWLEDDSGWEIKKWAGKLKVVAAMLTGIPVEKFEDQEFKKTLLGPEWGEVSYNNPLNSIEPFKNIPFNQLMTVREFLQKLGTNALRDGLHENVWVNALMSDYIGMYDLDTDKTTYPNWIITDTRFPNEAQAIKQANGIIIRVERPGVKPINDHPSEVSLDKWEFDHVIENKGSVEDLSEKVKQILQIHKILS